MEVVAERVLSGRVKGGMWQAVGAQLAGWGTGCVWGAGEGPLL